MRKKKILVVDDEKDILTILYKRLSSAGYEVFRASDGKTVFDRIKETNPDLILLDIIMPELDGFYVKAKLNEDALTRHIPTIFLTARDSVTDKVNGLSLGADDYITKPFDSAELLARIESALRKKDFYEKVSMTDPLTGLYNIRYFKKEITLFFNIAKRYKKIFSLAVVDVDNLKYINDMYGHLAGDAALRETSAVLKEIFRRSDIITRYGGDEFAVIMPETAYDQAAVAIERLKKKTGEKEFVAGANVVKVPLSISVGVATYEDTLLNESQIFELADRRLYENKSRKYSTLAPGR